MSRHLCNLYKIDCVSSELCPGPGTNKRELPFMLGLGQYFVLHDTYHMNFAKLHQESRVCLHVFKDRVNKHLDPLQQIANQSNSDSYVIQEHVTLKQSSTPNMSFGHLTYCSHIQFPPESRALWWSKPQRQRLEQQWTQQEVILALKKLEAVGIQTNPATTSPISYNGIAAAQNTLEILHD